MNPKCLDNEHGKLTKIGTSRVIPVETFWIGSGRNHQGGELWMMIS